MQKPTLVLATSLIALGLGACSDLSKVAGTANAVLAKDVAVNGSVNGPASQVALVAQGAGNLVGNSGGTYELLRLATETGIKNVTVRFTGAKNATAVSDDSGKFKVELPAGQTYKVSATFPTKAGGNATLSGFAYTDGITDFELGTSMNLVASKLIQLGAGSPDGAKVKELVMALDAELATKASLPEPTSESDAAAKFDETASADLQAKVKALAGK